MINLYLIEYEIDGGKYVARLPARDMEHAQFMALALDGYVLGSDVKEVSAIDPEDLKAFINRITGHQIDWPANACEQIEAFLSIGRKVYPEQL